MERIVREFGRIIIMGSLTFAGIVYPYTKFCYTARHYPGSRSSINNDAPVHDVSFSKKKSDYTFSYTQGTRHCFIRLKDKDRKIIQEQLASFPSHTVVDDAIIKHFLAMPREKMKMVGWVLQDFRLHDASVTVSDILTNLALY